MIAHLLRKETNLHITGNGEDMAVMIRGVHSIMLDTRPLYYFDGIAVDRSYDSAIQATNMSKVKRRQVLSSPSELTA